ncbi:unnamed protein product [Linum trigynum]|uniref:Uncharacterized protein n=1 Tax=Linum trigynum TaxID=586398 RepID=A0AAV2GUW9_9ROSI
MYSYVEKTVWSGEMMRGYYRPSKTYVPFHKVVAKIVFSTLVTLNPGFAIAQYEVKYEYVFVIESCMSHYYLSEK